MKETIIALIESLGYPGIALLMFAETVLIFLPSELIMPFAGFAAAEGKLRLLPTILAGAAGSSLGAIALYAAARAIPDDTVHHLIDRYGKLAGVSRRDYDRADKWFQRHALPAVFFGRLVPGIRSAISVPAGLARMPWPQFLIATITGSLIWTSLLAFAGYQLGERYEQVERFVSPISKIVLAVMLLAMGVYLLRKHSGRKNTPRR